MLFTGFGEVNFYAITHEVLLFPTNVKQLVLVIQQPQQISPFFNNSMLNCSEVLPNSLATVFNSLVFLTGHSTQLNLQLSADLLSKVTKEYISIDMFSEAMLILIVQVQFQVHSYLVDSQVPVCLVK